MGCVTLPERQLNFTSALDDEEYKRLAETLSGPEVKLPARADVILSEESLSRLLVIKSGWLCSYATLHDGRRQIFRFWTAGDVVGIGFGLAQVAIAARTTDRGLYRPSHPCATITEVVAEQVDIAKLAILFREEPMLILKYFSEQAIDHNDVLTHHLMNTGRRTAYERVAQLLCEMARRTTGLFSGDDVEILEFDLPVTQSIMADTLGLSSVHISRTLTELEEDGVIDRSETNSRTIIIRSPRRLLQIGGYDMEAADLYRQRRKNSVRHAEISL